MVDEAKTRLPRVRRKLAVRFGTGGDLASHGLTVNLSSRGIGLSSATVLPTGATLDLEVSLTTAAACRMRGTVVWSTRSALALNLPGTMGVRIDQPDPAFLHLLSHFVADDHDGHVEPASGARPHADWWQDPDGESSTAPGARPAASPPRVPRFFEQVPIRFGLTAQLSLRGFTENISRNGMAVSCPTPLTPNDTVLFALTLPDERLCHGTGMVMWSRLGREGQPTAHSMGIRIVRVEKTFKDLLEALARRH